MTSRTTAKTYQVHAVRSGSWWAITVPALCGVFSQAKRLDQVESMAREAIALMLDMDEADVGDIEVVVIPPAEAVDVLERLKASAAAATEATEAAAEARRWAARLLRDEGLPMRDVGKLIGVSHQRVIQILAD